MANKVSKKKYWIFKSFEILTVILPLIVLVVIRFDKYVYSKASAQALTIGGAMAIGVIALTALGKLHLKGLGWSILLLVMAYFLKNVLDDLLLILLCVVIGQVISRIFQYLARKESENITIEKSAAVSAEHTEKIIKKYHNSGRV